MAALAGDANMVKRTAAKRATGDVKDASQRISGRSFDANNLISQLSRN
jgi:hypothetical protein